jgi:hypothetical protein
MCACIHTHRYEGVIKAHAHTHTQLDGETNIMPSAQFDEMMQTHTRKNRTSMTATKLTPKIMDKTSSHALSSEA